MDTTVQRRRDLAIEDERLHQKMKKGAGNSVLFIQMKRQRHSSLMRIVNMTKSKIRA